ncbi:MAG TPA: AAA family ATPase [Chitinophagales bacterium]|nr:AAA family ATPase [Chitinophagales bacterium]
MQQTNQSVIRAFLNFLQGKSGSNPVYGGVALKGIDSDEPQYGFNIRLNNHDYILKIYDSHRKNEIASYIQLLDPDRPQGKTSILEYTVDHSNFLISNGRFVLKQNKAITIGTKQSGLKQESEQMMYDLGFPKNNIILEGDLTNPDFETIAESFFKWLSIRTQTKLTLEEAYRNTERKDLNSVFKKLIADYKAIRKSGKWDEIYKWELVNDFQKNWDIDSNDFAAMFKKIRFGNLLFANTMAANKTMAEQQPEGLRKCFKILYDESKPLPERMENYFAEVRALFKKADATPHHQPFQDERSIATYLCFKYPEKYTFYKSQFYVALCKMAGIQPAKAGGKYIHYLELIEIICALIRQDKELVELHQKSLTTNAYREKNYRILAQDILYRTLSGGYEQSGDDAEFSEEKIEEPNELPVIKIHSLNTILYGPPGTGKTYMTKELAVEIIDGKAPQDREELNKRYNELYNAEQIAFVTFHQSMSYEDFVEGIKPVMDADKKAVAYRIEDGIFKKLCIKAMYDCIVNSIKSERLRKTASFDNLYKRWIDELKSQIEENGAIESKTLKRGNPMNITGVDENENVEIKYRGKSGEWVQDISRKQILEKIYNKYESAEAIEKIKDLSQLGIRSGLYTNAAIFGELKAFESKNPNSSTDSQTPGFDQKRKIVTEYSNQLENDKVNFQNRYVLIIDEINRGNIAAILGELITLLEEDKRAGAKEAIAVTLPYSKENFSVPPNLYIIGTMNTADRSVEALDTALRRRFTFKEMMPQPDLLTQHFEDEGLQLDKLLSVINERIERLLDKDHLIGHSFFMEVFSWKDLLNAFEQKIIPQLKEYFYGDYGKIAAILGNGFVKPGYEKGVRLFPVDGTDYSDSEKPLFRFESFTNNDGSFDKYKFQKAIQSLIGQHAEQIQPKESPAEAE